MNQAAQTSIAVTAMLANGIRYHSALVEKSVNHAVE